MSNLPPELELYYQKKKIEEERRKSLSEEDKKRYELEKKYALGEFFPNEEIEKQAPSNVFDGINQDEFTIKSRKAIRSNLRNEGVEDIDEISEEDDEWNTPSRYY